MRIIASVIRLVVGGDISIALRTGVKLLYVEMEGEIEEMEEAARR